MSGIYFGAVYGIQGSTVEVQRAIDTLKGKVTDGRFRSRMASYDGNAAAIIATSGDVADFDRAVRELKPKDLKSDATIVGGIKNALLGARYRSIPASDINANTSV